MSTALRTQARGRWPSILRHLGVDARYLNRRNGPCPFCAGKDRFRFTDHEGYGLWICNQCGAGDGFRFIERLRGCDFPAAAREVEAVIGSTTQQPLASRPVDRLTEIKRLWEGSGRPIAGRPVSTWLRSRAGVCEPPRAIREHVPEIGHVAMVSAVRAPDGAWATLHQTFLTRDGQKAPIDKPRRFLKGLSIPPGSAVRLMAPDREGLLGIAEGIETALAASNLFGVPTWAALSAGRLETWTPPEGVRSVVVFGDRDENYAGQVAAFKLAERLRQAGLSVQVELPEMAGDWNDVYLAGRMVAAE